MPVQLPTLVESEEPVSAMPGLLEPEEQPEEAAEQPQEEQPDLLQELQAKLSALEQKVGTDDDVRAVKSQRDTLKNQLEQLIPLTQSLMAEAQAMRQSQVQAQFAYYDSQVAAYLNSIQDPAQRQAEAQRLANERQQALLALQLSQREQQLGQREMSIAEQERQRALQQLQEDIENRYEEIVREAGGDVSKLDKSSWPAMHQSAINIIKARTPARPVPTTPSRGSRGSQPITLPDWFGKQIAEGNWEKINEAFEVGKSVPGLRPQDIVRH